MTAVTGTLVPTGPNARQSSGGLLIVTANETHIFTLVLHLQNKIRKTSSGQGQAQAEVTLHATTRGLGPYPPSVSVPRKQSLLLYSEGP